MNGAVVTLLRRLGVELGLPFNPAGSEARPCRAGQLYRVDLGGRPFALKLYDEGYHNELTFHHAVAGTGIPVARIHACGDGPGEVDSQGERKSPPLPMRGKCRSRAHSRCSC